MNRALPAGDRESLIRAGHPDLDGLCLAPADWSAELTLIELEVGLKAVKPATAGSRAGKEGVL